MALGLPENVKTRTTRQRVQRFTVNATLRATTNSILFCTELRCPDCRSLFVAEVTDECGSLDKPKVATVEPKLSPALIVEESPVNTPPTVQAKEDDQSIGKYLASLLFYVDQIVENI